MEDSLNVKFEKRSRILFEKTKLRDDDEEEKVLCLNEVFCSESEISQASRYRIEKDNIDLGIFRSSGLIVSTGTGSTGWLYAIRQITAPMLAEVQKTLGTLNINEKVNEELAKKISDGSVFGRSEDRMYFTSREKFGDD